MGVAKSALQSVSRYLAKELGPQGIRCNLVAAGPVRTMAAKSIPGFAKFEDVWDERAPLGWDINDSDAGRQGVRRAAVGLVPRHHRRDRPRRRRVPRDRCRRAVGRARLHGVNRLAGETSPYLRQHRDNPVDWYPWGSEAFAAAEQRDVPILLSVGYSACHWCHVMAHECSRTRRWPRR